MTDIQNLKRLAEAASPGPWTVGCERLSYQEDKMMYSILGPKSVGDWEDWGYTKESAEYIAAANPSAILALIQRIEELEEEVKALNSAPDDCYP